MSCSIHFMMEYRRKSDSNWNTMLTFYGLGNGCYLSDSYDMFGALGNDERGNVAPIVPERGFPIDATERTMEAYGCIIDDEAADVQSDFDTLYSYCTEEQAKKWICDGQSVKLNHPYYNVVSDPDAHHPNWCTTSELDECIKTVDKYLADDNYSVQPDWYGILAFMQAYENSDYECRLIYWFDN